MTALLTRVAEAMEAQTKAICLQTEAIVELTKAQRELADAVMREEEQDDVSPFAHLGVADDRDAKDDPAVDVPAHM